MAGQTDQPQPPQTGNTPVPDLIERYRLRRDAWIAQADELARLRDEVRSSAEREAMEIVTAARRDVRKVIMEARRELLVLSAQVQAALGDSSAKTDPTILLNKAGITSESAVRALTGSTDIFAPEDAVNEILSEVQDDMTALAEDAKTLPLKAVPAVRQIGPSSSIPSPSAPPPSRPATIPPPSPWPASLQPDITPVMETIPEPEPFVAPVEFPDLSESVSKAMLASPFPSDAVAVPVARRLSTFVGALVGVGVLFVSITVWWVAHRNTGTTEVASGAPSTTPGPPTSSRPTGQPSSQAASTAKTTATNSANLSLIGQALRQVWVRTTIDGQADNGRTLAAGQILDVSAEESISLLVGDAGAIVVSVNKGEKRPLGRDGQVVTRQFAAEKSGAPRSTPTPAPATPAPERPAATRPAPPIASAGPAVAAPVQTPRSSPAPSAGIGSLLPTAPTPTPAPAPSVNQLVANPPQPTAPGVVNQLSAPPAAALSAAPSAAPAAAPSAAPAAAPAAVPSPSGSPATAVVAVARQWLDAYHRQDRAAMAALSTENLLLADERRADERFPPGLSDVTRTLDRVSVQIAADTAVLTAVMMEQSGSVPSPHVSPISQVWVLGAGQWKVRQARFVSEARLNQVFK